MFKFRSLFRVVERIKWNVFNSYEIWWYFNLFQYLYLGCKRGPFQATPLQPQAPEE